MLLPFDFIKLRQIPESAFQPLESISQPRESGAVIVVLSVLPAGPDNTSQLWLQR
jgi:hypothetical protein